MKNKMWDMREAIFIGFIMGTIARVVMLKSDYRQYPSYPQGYAVHIVIGAVSASIGAMVVPSILSGEYTAVSFFALAIQQFREVRNAERDTLNHIEKDEIVRRGATYIEDIARKFESRNYLAMVTALVVSISVLMTQKMIIGVIVGLIVFKGLEWFIKGQYIGDIGHIVSEELIFDDPYLKVGDVVLTNLATEKMKEPWRNMGVACRIIPKNENARMTLANVGQQKAIIHDVISQLGVVNAGDEPWVSPYSKIDSTDGSVVFAVITFKNKPKQLMAAVGACPVLESARRKPQSSKAYHKK